MRSLSSLALFLAVIDGARLARRNRADGASSPKFLAGVPILNYHMAYEGKSSFTELDTQKEQEWVLVVRQGTTAEQLQLMCEASRNACNLVGHPDKGGVPFLELRGTEGDLEHIIKSAHGAVMYVEPDQEMNMIPEIEVGAAEEVEATWGLYRIGAGQRAREGAGTTIFVLDTGVRTSHQEFGGRSASALDMTSGSLVECNGDAACAGDVQGHGTHCAGTAGGETYGVAPSASIRSVKVLGDYGYGDTSWSISALDWLATSPIRPAVASMSLGSEGTNQATKDAVDAAVNAGIVVVVAAGNSNADACGYSPAYVPAAITVGSTDSTDARSYFSNYGPCVQIWAPGSIVRSASQINDMDWSAKSGTSMACPHVSGAAALVLEADPSKMPSAVLDELYENGLQNVLTDLQTGDTNVLLFVGEDGATPAPTPEPPPAPPTPPPPACPPGSLSPDVDEYGDCMCDWHLYCFESGEFWRCPYSGTAEYGDYSLRWFLPTCTTCECLPRESR